MPGSRALLTSLDARLRGHDDSGALARARFAALATPDELARRTQGQSA